MFDLFAMVLLALLMVFTVGSGLCAVFGLSLLPMQDGFIFVVIGGGLAAVSFLAFRALCNRLSARPPEGPDERPN